LARLAKNEENARNVARNLNYRQPIVVNESGIYDLISKLGVRQYLTMDPGDVPPVSDWIFKRADYGRDSKKQVNASFIIPFKNFGEKTNIRNKKKLL